MNLNNPLITLNLQILLFLFDLFDKYEKEAVRVIELGYVHPAYDYVLKCSHTFNLLDSRGAISVSERTAFISRVRNLARLCAQCYFKTA